MKTLSEIPLLKIQAAVAAEQRDQQTVRALRSELVLAEQQAERTAAYRSELVRTLFFTEGINPEATVDLITGELVNWELPEEGPTPEKEVQDGST